MVNEIRDFIFKYGPWIIFAPTVIGLINYKKYSKEFKIVTFYLILSVIVQIISFILWLNRINNYPILHIYTILEFLVLIAFYFIQQKGFWPSKLYKILAVVFTILSICNSIWVENIYTYNTYARSIEALIIIFLSISSFVMDVSNLENFQQRQISVRFINAGFLIYFTGSILLSSFNEYIEKLNFGFRMNVWFIHTILTILLYILIAIGLWKQRKKRNFILAL